MNYLQKRLSVLLSEAIELIETEWDSWDAQNSVEVLKDIMKKHCGEEKE